MSTAGGQGAANDPTVEVDESQVPPEVAAYLNRMADRARAHYDEQHQIEGTWEHAAHVAQLRRLRDEARDAVSRARTALDRAREHADGKADALDDAINAELEADAALAQFVGSETRDGVE